MIDRKSPFSIERFISCRTSTARSGKRHYSDKRLALKIKGKAQFPGTSRLTFLAREKKYPIGYLVRQDRTVL